MSSLPPFEEGNLYNSPTQASQPGYPTPPAYNPGPGYMQPHLTPAPVYMQPNPVPVYIAQPQYMAIPVVPVVPASDPGSGQALTGMILGILSFPLLFVYFGFVGILPLLGLIFSIIGLRSTTRKGMAITGLILSSLCLIIVIVWMVFVVVLLVSEAHTPTY